MQGIKVSVVYHVHQYSVMLFETVKVMITIALIHLCFGGDFPLCYVQKKCYFSGPQLPYQGK